MNKKLIALGIEGAFNKQHVGLDIGESRMVKKSQTGFSNVQIAIGILVGVVVLLGSLTGYQYINQAKVNNELSTLNDLKAATTRYGQQVGTFTAANSTAAILYGLNFFPNGSATGGVNNFSGTITPAVGTVNTAGDSIAFTFTGVSTSGCKQIGTMVDNIASVVTINATTTKAAGAATSPASVGSACAAGDNNTIVYTLSR